MECRLNTKAPAILRNCVLSLVVGAGVPVCNCEEIVDRCAEIEPTKCKWREQGQIRDYLPRRDTAADGLPVAYVLRVHTRSDVPDIQRRKQLLDLRSIGLIESEDFRQDL